MKESSKTMFGHPKGLFYLFFAEMWERFSFYGMRALLVLYMTKQLLFEDHLSYGVYAAYMSLVYFTPLIGGFLADQYLGFRRSIIIGGVMMAIGHFLLSIELPIFFYGSLALIIVGNGFFKPNISSFVGCLYEDKDIRRDAGFTIFYMGINIGGALAPLLCAWLAESYGWHYGFMLAGIGMLVGLFYFQRGLSSRVFGERGTFDNDEIYNKKVWGLNVGQRIVILSILSLPFFMIILSFNQYEHYMVWLASFAILFGLIKIYESVDPPFKTRLWAVTYFTLLMAVFWAVFEQAGSSLTLFADRNMNLIGMNAAQTNSINSGFIILLAIPFSMLWDALNKKGLNPNSAIKAGIGLLLLGVGFVIFGSSAQHADEWAKTPMVYLIVGYLVLTIGELFISPIGLSKMSELSAPKYLAFIMGVFFTSSFYGHFFAGKIAQMTTINPNESNPFSSGILGKVTEIVSGMGPEMSLHGDAARQQLYSFVSVYSVFGCLAIAIGIISILISPIIKRWMNGVH